MAPLSYRQMADEVKAVGWEKTDSLEKSRKLKRMPEMIALQERQIGALREVWSFLDGLAKTGEKPAQASELAQEPEPYPSPAIEEDDDEF